MKLTNKCSFIDFLVEQLQAYLYHFTYSWVLLDILNDNMLKANTRQTFGKFTKRTGLRTLAGVSLTRDPKLPVATTKWRLDVRITLNKDALKNNYKIIPYNYWKQQPTNAQRRSHLSEAEEFVVGNIKELHKYILLIEMLEPGTNKYNTHHNSDLQRAKDALKAYQIEYGVPFKIINSSSW